MNKRSLIIACFLCIMAAHSVAGEYKLSVQLEQSLMKHLLGHWQISDSTQDVSGQWQPGQGASWHFYPILNGHAIQDDWISPPLSIPEPANGRQYGTNIRIFNPQKDRWEMAWASIKGQRVDTFVATESSDEIVMTGLFGGQQSRITFYAIKTDSFAWRLEFQMPDGSFQEIYRIQAKRIISTD